MSDEGFKNKLLNQLSAEDKVIVTSIVLTIFLAFLAPILWSADNPIIIPPPIISIFLGIAVSALLYRFLGGVNNASLTVGALKVTGTAAVLIGVAIWANTELEKYVLPKLENKLPDFNISKHVIPENDSWYAVDKVTGLPVALSFPIFKQDKPTPKNNTINSLRKQRNVSLKEENNEIYAYINSGIDNIVGKITIDEIKKIGFSNEYKVNFKPYKVIPFKKQQTADFNPKLPFILKFKNFSFSESAAYYSLISKKTNKEIDDNYIKSHGANIFPYEGRYFLISVVQFNYDDSVVEEPYAKIYVAEVTVVGQ